MLDQLLKYEIKATARLFLPLYVAVFLFTFINRLINPFEKIGNTLTSTVEGFNFFNMIRMISGFLYFALIIAIIAMTLIIMIQRFYKNLLGDEGYLMFTLPVRSWQHIVSKLLVSLLWILLSFIVIMVSILGLLGFKDAFPELVTIFGLARSHLGDTVLFLIPISALIIAAYSIVTIYNALSIGHLFSKHRILASFGAYFAIYMVSQLVFTVFVFLFANKLFVPLEKAPLPMPSQIAWIIVSLISVYALLGIANFIVANKILTKKLNLE